MMCRVHGAAALTVVCVLVLSTPAIYSQPLSEDAVAHLIRAVLLTYFDPTSVFEISVTGSRVSGEIVQIDTLTIAGKPVFLRGIRGEFFLQSSDLHLQASALYSQQANVRRVGKATIVARSTAVAMADALARASPAVINPRVRFHAGEFEIAAAVRREDKLYPTQARGKLVVERGQKVWVTITEVKVSGGDIPQNTIQQELTKINPVLDLSQWPLDLRIQRLTLHNDAIELLATK